MAEDKTATEGAAWVIEGQSLELNLGNAKTGSVSGEKLTLKTAGKWVDRNIEIAAPKVDVTIDNATVKSTDVVISEVTVGDKTGSDYAVTKTGVTVPAPAVEVAGFISATEGIKTAAAASVDAKIAAGSLAASLTSNTDGSASMAAKGFTASETATKYEVDLTTVAGKVVPHAGVATEGYVRTEASDGAEATVAVSGDGNKLYIPEAELAADAVENKKATVTLSHTATVQTAASGAYKVTVKGASQKGQVTATASADKVGMISDAAADQNSRTIDTTVAAIADEVVYIQAGEIHVADKDADVSAFAENTTAVVPSEGFLTIAEGYYPATKIALATLVPDEANITAADGAVFMLEGKTAYDKDGKLITGTIPTVVPTVSATDGQSVTVPAGYIAEAKTVTVDNGAVKLGTETQAGNFEVAPAPGDQTITIEEGWLEDRTITIKGSSNLGEVESAITANDAAATVDALAVGAANVEAGTVVITGAADITGSATAKTTKAGYSALNAITCEKGVISGTATVDATLPLYVGAYTLG